MSTKKIRFVLETLGVIALFYEHWVITIIALAAILIIAKVVEDGYAKKVIMGFGNIIMAVGGFCCFPYFAPAGVILAAALVVAWVYGATRL
jgi:hypothetical protein